MKRSDKKKIQYSLIAFVLLTVLIFFFASFLHTKNSQVLISQLQTTLELYEPETYTVVEPLTITNAISTMGTFYSVKTRQNATLEACIVRIMGIAGPVSTIFLHDNGAVNFIGVLGISNIDKEDTQGITVNQISYWENKLSQVFMQYFAQKEAAE